MAKFVIKLTIAIIIIMTLNTVQNEWMASLSIKPRLCTTARRMKLSLCYSSDPLGVAT